MDELVSLCKRRGFIYQTNEIYGGLQGLYDYGPLGVELKNNLKNSWWSSMVYERDDVEGLDSSILTHQHVLKYSGHEETFTDPLIDCRDCKARWRADHIKDNICPSCGSKNLTEPRPFNLMFKTNVGPVDDGSNFAYLRPETAQQIFTNFKNVIDSTSRVLPFGIAQIGKAFRNEITPRNFIFRVREFEQMELEFFVEPGTDEDWHDKWVKKRIEWWENQGISRENIELIDVPKEDLSHYSKKTIDIISKENRGILILVRDSSTSVISHFMNSKRNPKEKNSEPEKSELRIYGMGAQILNELKVRKMILLTNTDWKFIGLDAGMETLMRPALYGAFHRVQKIGDSDEEFLKYDITGRICENTDRISEDYDMPTMKEGDLCAIMDSGAYGYSMSHNFNTRPRPSEILIDQDNAILIRKRESIEDLFRGCDV